MAVGLPKPADHDNACMYADAPTCKLVVGLTALFEWEAVSRGDVAELLCHDLHLC